MFWMKKKPEPGWSCSRCGGLNVVEAKWHHGTGIMDCVTSASATLKYVEDHVLNDYPATRALTVLREAEKCLAAAIRRTEDKVQKETS